MIEAKSHIDWPSRGLSICQADARNCFPWYLQRGFKRALGPHGCSTSGTWQGDCRVTGSASGLEAGAGFALAICKIRNAQGCIAVGAQHVGCPASLSLLAVLEPLLIAEEFKFSTPGCCTLGARQGLGRMAGPAKIESILGPCGGADLRAKLAMLEMLRTASMPRCNGWNPAAPDVEA